MTAFFTYAFRPLFLLATLYAILVVPLWAAAWLGYLPMPTSLGTPSWWHAHEMIIGFAMAVRVQQQSWRQGTRSTKLRSEVDFAGTKPWKQKGTGRARCGTKASPLWRKGGVTFGPRPGVRTIKVNRAVRTKAMFDLFGQVVDEKRLLCLDLELNDNASKTSHASRFLKDTGLAGKQLTVFLRSDDVNRTLAFRNIPNVRIQFFNQPNVVDLSRVGSWAFLKEDKDLFEGMVKRWI